MDGLILRTEQIKDFPDVKKVQDLAFKNLGEGELVRLIRDSEAYIPELSIIAELGSEILGHVLFSKIRLIENNIDLNSLSLAPVAVMPAMQRHGIGRALIDEGIKRAKKLGYRSILVLGDPAYYGKFGFKHELTKNIRSRYECKDFAGLELEASALSQVKEGTAIYPDAFSVVD